MCPHDVAELYPILSQHWPSFPPVAAGAPPHIRELRFERDVTRLREIGARYLCRTWIDLCLDAYRRLDPEIVRALGGDRLPPPPIHAVGDERR